MMKTFDNADDLAAHMKKTKDFLDSGVTDWQQALKPGDFSYTVFLSNYQGDFRDITPFTVETLNARNAIAIYHEIIESLYPEDREHLRKTPNRRLVHAYSAVEPDGEVGTIHIASIWDVISLEDFATARAAGWPLYIPDRVMEELARG